MKTTKILFTVTLCFATIGAISCKSQSQTQTQTQTAHNSQNSLDWDGVYTSVLPCADCDGIQTTIVLNPDNSYEVRTKYLGKPGEEIVEKGRFAWDAAGRNISLSNVDKSRLSQYMVGENRLMQLGANGKRMSSDVESKYTLVKVSDIVEKYWKLIELNGQPVAASGNYSREPHFTLKIDDNRITGTGGCNSFFGTYVIEGGNRIKFSQMASSMMACLDMETESQFMRTLEMTDNYTINGDTLSLNRARMAPLARFVAVYVR